MLKVAITRMGKSVTSAIPEKRYKEVLKSLLLRWVKVLEVVISWMGKDVAGLYQVRVLKVAITRMGKSVSSCYS